MGSNPAWCTIFFPFYYKGIALRQKPVLVLKVFFAPYLPHLMWLMWRGWSKWQQSGIAANTSWKRRSAVRTTQQRKTFKTKSDAPSRASMIESEIDRGIFVSRVEAERAAFHQLNDRYISEICSVAPRRVLEKMERIKIMINSIFLHSKNSPKKRSRSFPDILHS